MISGVLDFAANIAAPYRLWDVPIVVAALITLDDSCCYRFKGTCTFFNLVFQLEGWCDRRDRVIRSK